MACFFNNRYEVEKHISIWHITHLPLYIWSSYWEALLYYLITGSNPDMIGLISSYFYLLIEENYTFFHGMNSIYEDYSPLHPLLIWTGSCKVQGHTYDQQELSHIILILLKSQINSVESPNRNPSVICYWYRTVLSWLTTLLHISQLTNVISTYTSLVYIILSYRWENPHNYIL